MKLSELAIKRPVLAVVISLVLVIFGLLSYNQLSVREFPDTDPPIISISTIFRGASATIIEKQVTQIIEDAIAGISGVVRITSTSAEASSRVRVEFSLSRPIEDAANDVRDNVARAVRLLPEQADSPRISKFDSGARPIMWLGLNSARMSSIQLTDFAERFPIDRLSVIDGVARVRLNGARRLAMRIWLDKQALAARGLTVQDVEEALEEQNINLPSGRIESKTREFSVRTDTGLTTEQEFRNVVISNTDGYLLRLGEVARVEVGPENTRTDYTQGYDVHMFDEDNVAADGSGPVYDEVVNAIQNRSVNDVAIYGYSHGGGSTYDLADRLDLNRAGIGVFEITWSSYVDSVSNNSDVDLAQELRRPPSTAYHANHYQHGAFLPDFFLDGGPVPDSNPPPTGLDVETTPWGASSTHFDVDDYPEVRGFMETTLLPRVTR